MDYKASEIRQSWDKSEYYVIFEDVLPRVERLSHLNRIKFLSDLDKPVNQWCEDNCESNWRKSSSFFKKYRSTFRFRDRTDAILCYLKFK